MGKIESETRKQIMNYYNEKIVEIEVEQRKLKKLIEEKQYDEFYNDTIVSIIKDYFKQLKEKYENKIIKLKKEKTQLLLTLENNSKTSNEYKKAINDFIKKVK